MFRKVYLRKNSHIPKVIVSNNFPYEMGKNMKSFYSNTAIGL